VGGSGRASRARQRLSQRQGSGAPGWGRANSVCADPPDLPDNDPVTGERTVPLLPCASIDDIEEFYTAIGFTRTYRQVRPNPHVVVERDDIGLHFFGMPGFEPADSYGTCLVVVPDIGTAHAAFAAGLREKYGKVPASGIPRMTRPRPRKNADGLTGFSLIDPGGNWIRFYAQQGISATDAPDSPAESKLAAALANAVVLGDSKGDNAQAAKILDGALHKQWDQAPSPDRADALVYRAELAVRLGDRKTAQETLDRFDKLQFPDSESINSTRQAADDLRLTLGAQAGRSAPK